MFRVVFFLVLFNHALSEKYVYITGNVIHIPCIDNPAPSLCKLDYKVPDLSTFSSTSDQGLVLPTTATLNKTITDIFNLWEITFMKNVSDQCKNALTNYYCTVGFPVCDDDTHTITVHGQKVKDACTTALQECDGLPQVSSFLPCSSMLQETHPKGHVCDDLPKIPDDPYPCTGGMYNETVSITEGVVWYTASHGILFRFCSCMHTFMILAVKRKRDFNCHRFSSSFNRSFYSRIFINYWTRLSKIS